VIKKKEKTEIIWS